MLPIKWTKSARNNLAKIVTHISADNPEAALKIRNLIEGSVLQLADHPYLFKSGRIPGTREVVAHANYVVVYKVKSDFVEIAAVLHTRQKYPA
jgi:toxin ParE1/3/4